MGADMLLDAGDVTVVEKDHTSCEDCGEPSTHYVMLDMRAMGTRTAVAELCQLHAELFAGRLRRSLRAELAVAAMRAWEEQLARDDGSYGVAEVRQAIRATLDALKA